MSETVELLVASLIDSGDHEFMIYHPEVHQYTSDNAVDSTLVQLVDNHVKGYGKDPSRSVFEAEWGQKLPVATEPAKFYLDRLRPIHVRKALQAAAAEAQVHLKSDPEKALAIISAQARALEWAGSAFSLVDFRQAQDRILQHLTDKWASGNFFSIGWKTFDDMSGGLAPGDFITLSAGTGVGKTYLLLSRAFHFWENVKVPVLFVSMEMTLDAVLERAAAMQGHIPFDYVKKGLFPNLQFDFKKKLLNALEAAKSSAVPFWFVDGNLAVTVDDLYRLCNQLQPAVVIVDGAYLLGGIKYKNRWELIAENASFMKQVIATQLRTRVIASYQFTRNSMRWHKKKDEAPGLEDIAGSQEVPNLASIALGMTNDTSAEGKHRRKVEILKGRNGEAGSFYTSWDFKKMAFDEIDPAPSNGLDFA